MIKIPQSNTADHPRHREEEPQSINSNKTEIHSVAISEFPNQLTRN